MKYEKPKVEVIPFDFVVFMSSSSGYESDTPLGNFTCKQYKQGASCVDIHFPGSGYSCGVYTNGNCQSVYSPPGSDGDGCHAWKLVCNHF